MSHESERKLQAECFKWCWNEHPETRGLLCYNLNNSKNRVDGARNRGLGLIPGRADFTLYWQGKAYFIEMKDYNGRQSGVQKKWEETVKSHGFSYNICRTFGDFSDLINKIVN